MSGFQFSLHRTTPIATAVEPVLHSSADLVGRIAGVSPPTNKGEEVAAEEHLHDTDASSAEGPPEGLSERVDVVDAEAGVRAAGEASCEGGFVRVLTFPCSFGYSNTPKLSCRGFQTPFPLRELCQRITSPPKTSELSELRFLEVVLVNPRRFDSRRQHGRQRGRASLRGTGESCIQRGEQKMPPSREGPTAPAGISSLCCLSITSHDERYWCQV